MNVALFYLAAPRTGGWVTFTAHLARALTQQGHAVQLHKIGARSERHLRPFGRGLLYRNVHPDEAVAIARQLPTVVTAVGPNNDTTAAVLAIAGATVVVHDPTELRSTLVDAVAGKRVVTIRQSVHQLLNESTGLRNTFIPHPYVRAEFPVRTTWLGRERAVSICRLDWDKRIDTIVEANKLLPQHLRVRMHGSENRLYTHHKLAQLNPEWRADYAGPFAVDDLHGGARIAGTARYVVDPSVIANDGGGTQYTFLEAWDAQAMLLVNRAWLRPGGALVDGHNCAAFSNGAELAALLTDEPILDTHAAAQQLEQHAPHNVVPQYQHVGGWT